MYTVTDTLAAAEMQTKVSMGTLRDSNRNTHFRKHGETGGRG